MAKLTPNQIKKISEKCFEDTMQRLEPNAYIHRFPDTHDIRRGGGTKVFLGKQPSDYFVVRTHEGASLYEVKGTLTDHYNTTHLEPSQKNALSKISSLGGSYNVVVMLITDRKWLKVNNPSLNMRIDSTNEWVEATEILKTIPLYIPEVGYYEK